MRGATRIAWIVAAGGAGLCGCARLDSALNFAILDTRPTRGATAAAAPATTAAAAASAQAAAAGPAPPAAPTTVAAADEAVRPQMLPPVDEASHETAKPPWSIFDILTPTRAIGEGEEAAPPPSEFTTVAEVQLSPAAVPTKEELLAKLKSRADVDAAEYDRWEKIVQGTPENDWPLVAIQLQAVLNYKSFQAAQEHTPQQAAAATPAPAPVNPTTTPAGDPAASAAATATATAPVQQSPPANEASPRADAAPGAGQQPPGATAAAAPPAEAAKPAEAPAAAPAQVAAATVAVNTPGEAKPEVLPPAADEKPLQPIAPASPAAASTEPPAGPWREHLELAIESLQAELAGVPDAPAQVVATATPASEEEYRTQAERRRERARKEAYLRLLYLAAQRPADAARGVEEFSPAEQEFWKHQLHGLGVFLDDQGAPVADRRARLALRELQQGMHHLAAASGLDVRNLAFCPQVFSFGNYVEFTPAEFRPGQEVLLYAEIDNFSVEPQPNGYETELQGSYQIFDAGGRRVAEHTFAPEKEICRNRRRDYFIPFRMYLPKRIDPGPYTLQLTIEDLKGRKFGQSSVRFAITP
jgi:hypothetical protein